MSSSTALLPKDHKRDGHPIFLRICHSPWLSIHQGTLVGLRLAIALYQTATLGLIIFYEITHNQAGWCTIFDFSNISYFLQVQYQWIALLWTFVHLHYPQHTSSNATLCSKLFSPPCQSSRTNNRFYFSLFYTAVTTFPHVATFIYWAVLVPGEKSPVQVGDIFGDDWLMSFFYLNKYGVNSILAVFEVFVLSSIKRATPIVPHVVGLIVLALLYTAWAGISYIITDQYPYYFLDHRNVGWEYVVGSVIIFVVLINSLFGVVYGLTALREKLTKKGEGKGSGYTPLPQ